MKLRHIPRDTSRFLRILAEMALLRRSPIKPGAPHTLPGKLVVSLTSYPPRFPTLDLTLRCLLNQDMAPDAIILWIAHDDMDKLPARVRALEAHGIEIRSCDDTGSFKKVVPACIELPNCFLLLCDDDVAYPAGWLRRFVEHWRYPDEVLCQWGRCLILDSRGRPLPWWHWPTVRDDHPHWSVMPIGCGGVLYPPGTLPPRVADADTFMRLTPQGDDIWLYWHFTSTGAIARCIPPTRKFIYWRQQNGLHQINDFRGANDRAIAAMFREFGLPRMSVYDTGILNGLLDACIAHLTPDQRKKLAEMISNGR